jgi:hypothetical protein
MKLNVYRERIRRHSSRAKKLQNSFFETQGELNTFSLGLTENGLRPSLTPKKIVTASRSANRIERQDGGIQSALK